MLRPATQERIVPKEEQGIADPPLLCLPLPLLSRVPLSHLARICRPLPRIQLRLPRIRPVVLCQVPGALAPREKWKAVLVPGAPQAPRERPVGHPESGHQSPP